MTWLVKSRFGGLSWLGGETGKVRNTPDIGSFSPAGDEYWGETRNIFKFLAQQPTKAFQIACQQAFYFETETVSKQRQCG